VQVLPTALAPVVDWLLRRRARRTRQAL